MRITSFVFIGFILITFAVCRVFPAKQRWWVLLTASAVFYLSHNAAGLPVLIGSALLVYFAGILVQKQKDGFSAWLKDNRATADKAARKAQKEAYQKRQKLIVAAATAITIGILFLC